MAGFLLSGFLMALLGAILPAWGYYRDPPEFIVVGNYFLSLAAGLVVSTVWTPPMLVRPGPSFLLVFGSLLSCGALVYLAMVPPPAPDWWRMVGLLPLGMAAGMLNLALFRAASPAYQKDAVRTFNRGGIWHGLGCLVATLVVAATFSVSVVPSVVIFLAAVPAIFVAVYVGTGYASAPSGAYRARGHAGADSGSSGAALFALLLFFQTGNEWSIAGWLPLFLIRRVGLSPSAALLTLAWFWLCLMLARLVAVAILHQVRHGRLLLVSGLGALFGCLLLYYTNNAFGAATGAAFLGGGFASIYPMVAAEIGRRFPYYRPGFFNGIFSVAMVGGFLAPASLGYAASLVGVGIVMGVPLVGTCMVVLLLLLIWLQSKVTGR